MTGNLGVVGVEVASEYGLGAVPYAGAGGALPYGGTVDAVAFFDAATTCCEYCATTPPPPPEVECGVAIPPPTRF